MAKLRSTQPPPLPATGLGEPDAAPLPLSVVFGRRPGREDPAGDARWREIDDATLGGEFDVRVCLTLDPTARADWEERRRAWLRSRFANDPRVLAD